MAGDSNHNHMAEKSMEKVVEHTIDEEEIKHEQEFYEELGIPEDAELEIDIDAATIDGGIQFEIIPSPVEPGRTMVIDSLGYSYNRKRKLSGMLVHSQI